MDKCACSGLEAMFNLVALFVVQESKLGKQTDLEKLMVEVRTAAAWHQLRGTCQGEGFRDAWS